MMAGRINSFYGTRPNLKDFAPEGIEGELRRLHYDTANATFAPSMAALMKLVPVSQITYGSDYPYFGFGQFADLQKLGLSAGRSIIYSVLSKRHQRLALQLASSGASVSSAWMIASAFGAAFSAIC
jgi:hypothetical protein